MRLKSKLPEAAKSKEKSDEKGIEPPKGSLLKLTTNGAIVGAAGSRVGRIGLGALFGSSPSLIELVLGGVEAIWP